MKSEGYLYIKIGEDIKGYMENKDHKYEHEYQNFRRQLFKSYFCTFDYNNIKCDYSLVVYILFKKYGTCVHLSTT
jgi:hypothetical protein